MSSILEAIGQYSPGFLLLLFALGMAVGLLGSFFGMGGGWIITSTLNILGMAMSNAVGTSFAYISGMCMISAYKHRKRGNIELRLGLILGSTIIIGIHFGKNVVMLLDKSGHTGPVVRVLYIILLFGLGLFMLKDTLKRRQNQGSEKTTGKLAPLQRIRLRPFVTLPRSGIVISVWPLLAIGLLVGFLSGILGVGGGFMLVPTMVYLIGMPTLMAVGTSLICLVLTSPFGAVTYAMAGCVNFTAAGVMILGACIGAPLGVRASHHVHGDKLRVLYAIMIMLGGSSVFLRQCNLPGTARTVILGAVGGMTGLIIFSWRRFPRPE